MDEIDEIKQRRIMEFKRKHTKGQFWEIDMWSIKCGHRVFSGSKYIACFDNSVMGNDEQEANALLLTQAPAMLEYMVDRADFLEKEIEYADSIADHYELIGFTEPEKREELSRLLEIIKAAGVEVVDEER